MTATILSILGIWGFIDGDTTASLVFTLLVVCAGVGVSGAMIDKFFKDKDSTDITKEKE